MLCAIDMGLPPLNAVCKGLESTSDCSSMQVRQIVGMEIKFILSLFGYDIDDSQDRPALRKSCKGKYFKTGAFYKQVRKSQYTLNVEIGEMR